MYYLIIPKKAGDSPDSWYQYLLLAGPVTIYLTPPEANDEEIVLRFYCREQAVTCFHDTSVFNRKEMTLNFSFIPLQNLAIELFETTKPDPLVRLCTGHFFNWAWRLNIDYYNQSLGIGNKTYYLLSSGLFRNPPVSISRKPENREIVYYNPDSATLDDCYKGLCTTELIRNNDACLHNLDCVARFVRGVFEYTELEKVQAISLDDKNKTMILAGPRPAQVKVVNLKRFINAGVGVCRHNAMLVCYLLERMIKDRWLPEGEIIHFRMSLNKVGHSFVLFRTTNHQEIYVVDGTRRRAFHLPNMHTEFLRHYDHDIYATIRTRYLLEVPLDPTQPIPEEEPTTPLTVNLM